MPLSRPLLFALLGAVLIGAAFVATRGSGDTVAEPDSAVAPAPEADNPAPPANAPKLEAKPEAPATKNIRTALEGATAVKSGTFSVDVSSKAVTLTASGKFQSQGLSKLPEFQMDITAETGGKSFKVGAVSAGGRGYLVRDNQAVTVADKGWTILTRARAQAAERGPDKTGILAAEELNALKFRGQASEGGTSLSHFAAPVSRKQAREDFNDMGNLLAKAGLDSPVPQLLERSAQGGTLDVWVGVDDHLVHRARYRYRTSNGPFELDYRRANLNEPQTISPPANASAQTPVEAGWDRDSYGLAFGAMLVSTFVIEPGAGPSKKTRTALQRQDSRTISPTEVKEVLQTGKVVILFFRQSGADDDAVAAALRRVGARRGVAVFTLPVGQAPKFAEVGGSNVIRAPTLLLLHRKDQPRMFEGFIDPATLAQAVSDAR